MILESVRRIFHGNYSCQVSMLPYCCVLLLLEPLLVLVLVLNIIVHCAFFSLSPQGKNRAGWGAVSNTGEKLLLNFTCTFQNWDFFFCNFPLQVELRVFYPPVTAPPADWKVSLPLSPALSSSSTSSSPGYSTLLLAPPRTLAPLQKLRELMS